MDKLCKRVTMDIDMKPLREIRLSLLLLTVVLVTFFGEAERIPFLWILLGFNVIILLLSAILRLTTPDFSTFEKTFQVAECLITPAYMFILEPLWLLGFLFVLVLTLPAEVSGKQHFLIYGVTVLGAAALLLRSHRTVLFLLPSLAVLPVTSGYLYSRARQHRSDFDYLKKMVDNKNRILSTLTHELRTPLAVIKTSSELVLEERPGPINETQRSLLSSSLENTLRLISLVENILSRVKVEFAWFSMKKKIMDIRPVIRKVALDIGPYLETRKQTIHYNYPGLLSRTNADGRWIQQVLLNLIHNGSKNSPEGSKLEISVNENEQCIVVAVQDCGSGIGNGEISRVFNEFYQSEDPAKNRNDGAGLGLTIVRDIVEKHGGNVYISSSPPKGTVVSFTLPVYKGVLSETFGSGH